jgi:hypothetical protein
VTPPAYAVLDAAADREQAERAESSAPSSGGGRACCCCSDSKAQSTFAPNSCQTKKRGRGSIRELTPVPFSFSHQLPGGKRHRLSEKGSPRIPVRLTRKSRTVVSRIPQSRW